jgi:hypothetical protein
MNKQTSRLVALSITTVVIIVLIVVGVVLLVRHNNSNKSSSLNTAQTNAAKQQIETNWKTFFAASTSLQGREQVLQNGSQFTQPIQTEFAALGSSAVSSESPSVAINNVSLINSTSANVIYTIDLNGQPVLNNEKGEALLVNNNWKVSDATLCQLLSLDGDKPSVCQNV